MSKYPKTRCLGNFHETSTHSLHQHIVHILKLEQFELFWCNEVTYTKTTQTTPLLRYSVSLVE